MGILILSSTLVLFVLGCASQPIPLNQAGRAPTNESKDLDPYYFDLHPDAKASCKDFFKVLRNSRPKTVVEALTALKAIKPKFFSHYSLMHTSLSLHESSAQYPRALVYGADAQMIVSFNGHPDQRNYSRLEIMCFNEKIARFEFRDIAFPAESKTPLIDLSRNEQTRPFVISEPNGRPDLDCRGCHGQPAKPNWNTYPTWPGAFGALDDSLFSQLDEGEQNTRPISRYAEAEKAAWKKYSPVGRYSVLEPIPAGSRPNLRLGRALARLNAISIVARLKNLGARFQAVKVPFAKALFCPINGAVFVGQNLAPADSSSKELIASIRQSLTYYASKDAYLRQDYKIKDCITCGYGTSSALHSHYRALGFSPEELLHLGRLQFEDLARITEIKKIVGPLGVDTSSWSLILFGGDEFVDGNSSRFSQLVGSLRDPFLEKFFANDTELKALVSAVENQSFYENQSDPMSRALTPEVFHSKVIELQNDVCRYLETL